VRKINLGEAGVMLAGPELGIVDLVGRYKVHDLRLNHSSAWGTENCFQR